jgi:hypothetical protein
MAIARPAALLALVVMAGCAGDPGRRVASAGCSAGALDSEAVASMLMAGAATPVAVFGKGCGSGMAMVLPREGRRRAAMSGVLLALK